MTRLFYALILLFSASTALAAEVAHLYQAKALVSSQAKSELDRATPELLREVIVRVVGDRQKVNNADLSAVFADPGRYIANYSYQRVEPEPGDLTTPEQLKVVMNFNETALNNALTRIGLPLWDRRRPDVLLWVATDRDGSAQLYSDADPSKVLAQLREQTQRRGLPIVLPLMDLQDQTHISFNDIWTGNNDRITEASERYGAPVIVTLRIRGSEETAGISWQMLMHQTDDRWQSEGSLESAIAQGVDALADRLGRLYAWTAGAAQPLAMQITGVNNFNDYNRVIGYLEAFQGISDIQVEQLQDQQLQLRLVLQGDTEGLKQLLRMGRVLQASDEASGNTLNYRLVH